MRNGDWVLHTTNNNQIGIIVTSIDAGTKEVHYVAEDGTTASVKAIPEGELVKAKYEDIPVSRRGDLEWMRSAGY